MTNILLYKAISHETNVSALSVWGFNVSHWASLPQHLSLYVRDDLCCTVMCRRTDSKAIKSSCFYGHIWMVWQCHFQEMCWSLSHTIYISVSLSPSSLNWSSPLRPVTKLACASDCFHIMYVPVILRGIKCPNCLLMKEEEHPPFPPLLLLL